MKDASMYYINVALFQIVKGDLRLDKILSLNMDLEPHYNQLTSLSCYYFPTLIKVA